MASKHPLSLAWIVVFVVSLWCACCGAASSRYDEETLKKFRANYRFDAWPGKDLPAKSDLSADQITKVLVSWLEASELPAENFKLRPEVGGLNLYLTAHGVVTSRSYLARPHPVNLDVYWAEQSAGAHDKLMAILSVPGNAAGAENRGRPPGGEAGNVCYRNEPGVRFAFIRNNILVVIKMDPDRPKAGEEALALGKLLDKAIVANPPLPKPSDEALRWCETVQLAPARLKIGEKMRVTTGKVPAGTTWAVAQGVGSSVTLSAQPVAGAAGGHVYVGVARESGVHKFAAVLLRAGTGEVRAKRELRVSVLAAEAPRAAERERRILDAAIRPDKAEEKRTSKLADAAVESFLKEERWGKLEQMVVEWRTKLPERVQRKIVARLLAGADDLRVKVVVIAGEPGMGRPGPRKQIEGNLRLWAVGEMLDVRMPWSRAGASAEKVRATVLEAFGRAIEAMPMPVYLTPELVRGLSVEGRSRIAASKNARPKALAVLADDPDVTVRRLVAANLKTPYSRVERMKKEDGDPEVRKNAQENLRHARMFRG